MFPFIFLSGFILLLLASVQDIKNKEVEDWIFLLMMCIGLITSQSILILLNCIIFIILGYVLYLIGFWGGADSKLIWGISTLFPVTSILYLGLYDSLFLMIVLICCAVSNRILNKNKQKEIPFVPFILLSYILAYLIYFFIVAN